MHLSLEREVKATALGNLAKGQTEPSTTVLWVTISHSEEQREATITVGTRKDAIESICEYVRPYVSASELRRIRRSVGLAYDTLDSKREQNSLPLYRFSTAPE